MKHAVVVPALKKSGSDASVLTNDRPISNITFVAKMTERFVAQQLQHFMEENGICGIYQCAYHAHHSAETALVRIHNDIAQSIDSRRSVLLVLLDLSAAFDTINHKTPLRRLAGYGLSGDVLAWLTSYLCNRTCVVRVKSGVSEVEAMTTGVPQGTVLGPLLFNAYIAPLTTLLQQHNIHHHLFADDVCRSAYYHLSRIAKIRDSVSTTVCKNLIHGLVTSRIDYGNAILFGISDRHLHRLEMVQRSAARIVMQIRRGDRQFMTTILRQLHWLPVRKRIDYKLLVVRRALYHGMPEYLAALLLQHAPRRSRVTPRSSKSELGMFRPPCICLCRTHSVKQTP